ncbi:MAG: DUF433 domain-containing protein [Pusillimonas sp.]|nr:DUF433 domain-containing protein [Pusillimonas sp.]
MQRSTVSTAEAAFLAGLSERKINQAVDDRILPGNLYEKHARNRRFTPMAAAFAKFYFDTEDIMVANTRKTILNTLLDRIQKLHEEDRNGILMLRATGRKKNWQIHPNEFIEIDFNSFITDTKSRFKQLEEMDKVIERNPSIMQGEAVFKGTRVPVHLVLEYLKAGESLKELQEDYPFLTENKIKLAKLYNALHPKRGRPKSVKLAHPEWRIQEKTIIQK